jgi:hypothetical protein
LQEEMLKKRELQKNIMYEIYRKFNPNKQKLIIKARRRKQSFNSEVYKNLITNDILSERPFDKSNSLNAAGGYQSNCPPILMHQLAAASDLRISTLWPTESKSDYEQAHITHQFGITSETCKYERELLKSYKKILIELLEEKVAFIREVKEMNENRNLIPNSIDLMNNSFSDPMPDMKISNLEVLKCSCPNR